MLSSIALLRSMGNVCLCVGVGVGVGGGEGGVFRGRDHQGACPPFHPPTHESNTLYRLGSQCAFCPL